MNMLVLFIECFNVRLNKIKNYAKWEPFITYYI